jgi:hypothetical protein
MGWGPHRLEYNHWHVTVATWGWMGFSLKRGFDACNAAVDVDAC